VKVFLLLSILKYSIGQKEEKKVEFEVLKARAAKKRLESLDEEQNKI
jgi:hypothetical protein